MEVIFIKDLKNQGKKGQIKKQKFIGGNKNVTRPRAFLTLKGKMRQKIVINALKIQNRIYL